MNQIRNLTELKLTNNMLEVAQGIRMWRRFRRAGSDASRPCGIVFFPRVRTPCGHGAQVIVEGREEKTDGGERNEDPKNQPKTKHPSPQADSTIL